MCREYPLKLRSGTAVTLGFSLADASHGSMSRMKRACAALHLGLLVVLGDPDTQDEAVVWIHQAAALTLVAQSNDDISIGPEVAELLPQYFAVFFEEIGDLAPGLAGVRLVTARTALEPLN